MLGAAPLPDNKGKMHSHLEHHGSLGYGKNGTYTYSEVMEMTNNFEKVIGRGGSGTIFYGRVKDGREVAVKKVSSRILEQARNLLLRFCMVTRK